LAARVQRRDDTETVGAAGKEPVITPVMPTMRWRRVTWPQRGFLVGVATSTLAVATGAVLTHVASTTLTLLLWGTFVLNALQLLVLGPITLVTTRRWFRGGLLVSELRQQRRAVRRRVVLLGLTAYLAHQTLVVLLDPRFSLERLTGRRRMFGSIVAIPDRVELAWAFTVLALAYIILAWLLWRSARVPDLVPSEAPPERSSPLLEGQLVGSAIDAVEVLPRDPVTGRVVRQFDV